MQFPTYRIALMILLTVMAAPLAQAEDAAQAEHASDAHQVVPDWLKLPDGIETGETAGVGVDSHNHVFIFHRGADMPIMCVEGDSGKIVASFGEGLFTNAHGLEIDKDDNVWVTDTLNHQVYKFSHGGDLLLTLGEKGVSGLDETHFNLPTDVVVTPDGEFYVSDGYGNSRVVKFDANGKFLFDWGKRGTAPGEFNLPHGLTLDPQGRVYVADRTNMRIQVFTADGKYICEWGAEQLGEVGRPWGLEYAPDGYLYVIDGSDMQQSTPNVARITKLTLEGEVLETWGSYGTEPGQFSWGHDLAVGRDGAVYTAEVRNNNRAQKFVKK